MKFILENKMKRVIIFNLLFFSMLSFIYSNEFKLNFNKYDKLGISLFSETQDETNNKNTKEDIELAVSWGFYVFGSIFPVTNLLLFPYFGHYYTTTCLFTFGLPGAVVGLFFGVGGLSAALGTFLAGGYKYISEPDNETYRILFVNTIICGSIAYVVNLIIGCIGIVWLWCGGGGNLYWHYMDKLRKSSVKFDVDGDSSKNINFGTVKYLV